MPENCEHWLCFVNNFVYYTRQIREIYQVLPYSMDIKAFETHWVRQYLVNVVLFGVEIWDNLKAQKKHLRRTCKYFPNFWDCMYVQDDNWWTLMLKWLNITVS